MKGGDYMDISQPKEVRKTKQVRLQIDLEYENLKKLSDVVYSLEGHFRPVLSSSIPTSDQEKRTDESTIPLVNEFQGINDLISSLTKVLEELIIRCEL